MQVHQFHTEVNYGDAIGNQMWSLQRLLRKMGYRSEVFCEQLPLDLRSPVRPIAEYDSYSSPQNLLLVHFSRACSPNVLTWLRRIPDRKVLVYHNITPDTFFVGVNPLYAQAAKVGREQLGVLRTLTEAGWGDSSFDIEELEEQGWVRLGVLPIVFEPRRYAVRPDREVLQRLQQGFTVLSVGRLAPSKRLQDLLVVFYHLKRLVRPDARLVLVGSGLGMEPYVAFLKAVVSKLDLHDVVFAGHVSMSQLVAYYRRAGVYLSMSAHEGFGVPLLESAHFGVPVVAYKAGAVPDTLAGRGILITARDHPAVAELLGLLAEDQELCGRLVARQRERVADFMPERVAERLQILLQELEV